MSESIGMFGSLSDYELFRRFPTSDNFVLKSNEFLPDPMKSNSFFDRIRPDLPARLFILGFYNILET